MDPIKLDPETVTALCALLKVNPDRVTKIVVSSSSRGAIAVVSEPERNLAGQRLGQ